MAKTMNDIINDIESKIIQCGGSYATWYVGVTSDPRDRLFKDHNVDEKNDAWIFIDCGAEVTARRVEVCFLDKGLMGGPGGGDYTTKFVYAYNINDHTVE